MKKRHKCKIIVESVMGGMGHELALKLSLVDIIDFKSLINY